MVNMEWYRSFLAVYRAGTVSGAARALFLTQPAVTQHLAALESVVGEPLFQRAPRRMIPTTRGKELYCKVVQALETLELVSQEVQGLQADLPLLRCGVPREYFSEVLLERFVTLPYRLIFQFHETPTLIEELEREQVDVVIATQQIASRDIEYHKMGEEHFCLVGALEPPERDTSLSEEQFLKAREQWLSAQIWISYGVELPIIRRFWQQSFGKRPPFQAMLIIPDLRAIVKAIQEVKGISVLPEYLCREAIEAGHLCILWEPAQKVTNELWLAYHKTNRNDEKIKRLRTILNKAK
jgi:DNA-binding transcriptional LysR family regulator